MHRKWSETDYCLSSIVQLINIRTVVVELDIGLTGQFGRICLVTGTVSQAIEGKTERGFIACMELPERPDYDTSMN